MRKAILLFIILLFCSSFLQAEGTKQILLNDGGHGKVQVMPSFSNFAWFTDMGSSAPQDYRLHIHIKSIGEVIYYGFGDLLDNNDMIFSTTVTYRIKDPTGAIVAGPATVPTSGTGHINSFTQAVAGPAALAGSSGYTALSYTPTKTGDFFIEFNFSTGMGNPDRCKFKYFDITVGSSTNHAIDGRVWSKAWQMTSDGNGTQYDFEGTLFIYTVDSVVTSVNCNGMAPYVFTIACNQYGCYNTGIFENDRRSVSGKHIIPQYKIFLNNPDSLVYPTGILGEIIPPVTTTSFCDGTVIIHLTVNKAGNADVWLDINPASGIQAEDRVLSSAVNFGQNDFAWDGLNGLGQPVPNGAVFNIKVSYINGLTNLPIYDIDDNPNGFIINLNRPSGPVPGVFWDDDIVGGGQNINNGCIYTLPTSGCHYVPYSIGNNNTINTWWNAVVDTSFAPITFRQKRYPQPLGAIQGLSSLCPGTDNVRYYVAAEPNSQSYQWSYSGTGATITGNGNDTVYISFSGLATSGSLSVVGFNDSCGAGQTPSFKSISLLPFPNVTFSAFGPVCIDDPAFPLTGGSPAGGTYTIGGFPVTTFDPAVYGAGSHIVSYTYSDPGTGCTKSIDQTLTVSALPVVTIAPLPSVCENSPSFTLTGGSPAGGTYTGPGVTGATFDPAAALPGVHNIIYTYTDPVTTCTNSDTTTIIVFAVTPVTFTPFAPVCEDVAPFTLTNGTPAGGVYSGNGISGGITFDPASAGVGTHNITYTYTNLNGCVDSASQTIIVLPLPGTPGTINGPVSLCQGTASSIFSTTPIADALTYTWSITPAAAGTITGTTTTMTVTWNTAFTGPVQIIVTGVNGCGNGPASNPFNVTVLTKPVVSYSTCNDSVTVTTASPIVLKGGLPLGGIYSGAGVNSGLFYPNLAGMGVFTITYSYTNNDGCTQTATRTMRVQNPAVFTCGNTFRDIRDNKTYPTVKIGTQCWMAANLNYGNAITSSVSQRDNCTVEKYCYNDNSANCTTQGGLYQWDEMMSYQSTASTQGLCPPTWHVPSESEWNTLFLQYINSGFAGNPLKYTGYADFDAYLFGAGHMNREMNWNTFATMFWTSSSHGSLKAWAHGMNSYDPSVSKYPSYRNNAFQVRCIKN